MKRTGIYITVEDLNEWKRVTFALGYGEKSKYKLLRKLLRYASDNPSLFSNG